MVIFQCHVSFQGCIPGNSAGGLFGMVSDPGDPNSVRRISSDIQLRNQVEKTAEKNHLEVG